MPIVSGSTVTNRRSLHFLFVAVHLLLYLYVLCKTETTQTWLDSIPGRECSDLFLEWVYFKDFFSKRLISLSLSFSLICRLPLSVWTGMFYFISLSLLSPSPPWLSQRFFFFVCPLSRCIRPSSTLITHKPKHELRGPQNARTIDCA